MRKPSPTLTMDLQKQLELFHATPPRLFPHQDFQRPMIASILAMTAATDKDKYEERLEVYNRFCDELGVERFPRITIHQEESPADVVAAVANDQGDAEVAPEEPVQKPRGRRKKADSSPTA